MTISEYHDRDNPLPAFDSLRRFLEAGAVLIVSLELAQLQGQNAQRLERYHMLSFFDIHNDFVQVWDTNDHSGFLAWSDIEELLIGHTIAYSYPPHGYLISHDQHNCLLLARCSTDT